MAKFSAQAVSAVDRGVADASQRIANNFQPVTPFDPRVPTRFAAMDRNWTSLSSAINNVSGYASSFREGEMDQGHHLALFIQFGLKFSAGQSGEEAWNTGFFLGGLVEAVQMLLGGSTNIADAMLGAAAYEFGAQIRNGTLASSDVEARFLEAFCDKDRRTKPQ